MSDIVSPTDFYSISNDLFAPFAYVLLYFLSRIFIYFWDGADLKKFTKTCRQK